MCKNRRTYQKVKNEYVQIETSYYIAARIEVKLKKN